jgi:hypothetical protein
MKTKEYVIDGNRTFIAFEKNEFVITSSLPRDVKFISDKIINLTDLRVEKDTQEQIREISEEEAEEIRNSTEETVLVYHQIDRGKIVPKISRDKRNPTHFYIPKEIYDQTITQLRKDHKNEKDWVLNNMIVEAWSAMLKYGQ